MEQVPLTILSEHRCHLGEGPVYDPASRSAWWFDILERKLFEADIAAGSVTVRDLPLMASVLAPIDEARQLLAAENGLYVREVATGTLTLLQAFPDADPRLRSNDGRVHPSGALWIGTMGRKAEEKAGSIWWFREGEIRRIYLGITIPNAICFSPDGRAGYWTDTNEGILWRVDLDPETGLPAGEPAIFFDHRGGVGGLDGAVVDAEGHVWCARWGGSCVDRYAPTGARVRTVRVPASRPSCPAFVGASLDRMLVTTASEGMSDEDKAAEEGWGRTYLLDVGVTGLPEPRVKAFAS